MHFEKEKWPIIELSDIQTIAIEQIMQSFSDKRNPICALDMGLGKTRIACKIIQKFLDKSTSSKILIIHKASHHEDPWLIELDKSEIISLGEDNQSNEKYIYLHGKNREEFLLNKKYLFPKKANILLTTYNTARIDLENNCYDLSVKFDLIIFDEIHTIINYWKLTSASKHLLSLQARHKLAITGTFIQNSNYDLGLLYIFLNYKSCYAKIGQIDYKLYNIDKRNNSKKFKKKLEQKLSLLKKGLKKSIDSNDIFFYFNEKKDYVRISIVLSLPVDREMLSFIDTDLRDNHKKKLMYLSHPASIYYLSNRNQKFPYCTKMIAVEIILKNMLADEKIIIFSLYIDVLHIYFDICEKLGFSSILITGSDKGKKLDEKINYFKYSSQFRVLLTTLQKSSEGFNFEFATHIIILEFWWNPHKIFQAMSRIDRKKQNRNIFIYLLCYNKDGELLREEYALYNTMKKKSDDALEIYKAIAEKNQKIKSNSEIKTRIIPEMQQFLNMQTFTDELKKFLEEFHITTEVSKRNFQEIQVYPIETIRQYIQMQIGDSFQKFHNLLKYPSYILSQEAQVYISNYFVGKLNGTIGEKIIIDIDDKIIKPSWNPPDKSDYYPFVFIKYVSYGGLIFGTKPYKGCYYVIGRRQNGRYDLLHIEFGLKNPYEGIFSYLYKIRFARIDAFIIYSSQNPITFKKICYNMKKYFPKAECQMCLTSLVKRLMLKGALSTPSIYDYQKLFYLNDKSAARDLCNNFPEHWNTRDYIKYFTLNFFDHFSHIYNYPIDKRMIICTTNIIDYITKIVEILMQNAHYKNKIQTKREIEIVSRVVLENCSKIIPIWKKLTLPIEQKK